MRRTAAADHRSLSLNDDHAGQAVILWPGVETFSARQTRQGFFRTNYWLRMDVENIPLARFARAGALLV
jgi:hypothetical protein